MGFVAAQAVGGTTEPVAGLAAAVVVGIRGCFLVVGAAGTSQQTAVGTMPMVPGPSMFHLALSLNIRSSDHPAAAAICQYASLFSYTGSVRELVLEKYT